MQSNVETQHKHMYSLCINSLCNIALSMARFTCIVTLVSAFYRGSENINELSSALMSS